MAFPSRRMTHLLSTRQTSSPGKEMTVASVPSTTPPFALIVIRTPSPAVPDNTGLFGIDHFAQFIRGTLVPPRDPELVHQPDVKAGEALFAKIECSICHVSRIVTAPLGTVINVGAFTIPDALGNKIIHPFSDFLLHDIGTGDGIVEGGPQDTQHKLRTAALWGVRTKTRFMHDLKSESFESAILRHQGEASDSITQFKQLNPQERSELLKFLSSL
jgi:CxxC motif-containing protein (DUF1111 family)